MEESVTAYIVIAVEMMAITQDKLYHEIKVWRCGERRMVRGMPAIELSRYTKYTHEISELKKEVERLKKVNSELDEKVLGIYGAYETLQYTTRGRLMSCSAEIVKLRREIESLKSELRARGWMDQPE